MDARARRILDCLRGVAAERQCRLADPTLGRRAEALKRFQHDRFARTYSDLLQSPGYAAAARFFLTELYGPYDFADRDRQFERIVPALVRLFPDEIVETVQALAELHLLSELMDSRMAAVLSDEDVDLRAYGDAWRKVGQPELREQQITLTLMVGSALERYTRRVLLRKTLAAMRRPAQMAGLSALQRFLESGFDTFREMPDARQFLRIVGERERAFAAQLFEGRPVH